MTPSGKYLVGTAGKARDREIQNAIGGLVWMEVELSGTSDTAAERPPKVWVGLDAETGTRWVAILTVNPDGLTAGQLRDLGVYGRQGLDAHRMMTEPAQPQLDDKTLRKMVLEYRPPQRVVLDYRFLTWVAAYYETALELSPERPTSWMAEQLGRSTKTVDRWIETARESGLISQTVGRRKKKPKGGVHDTRRGGPHRLHGHARSAEGRHLPL